MTQDFARGSVVAIFDNLTDAENALRELREDGFSANRLGCATGDQGKDNAEHRSFWQKVEGFFTGEEGYENRDTGSGDGTEETGRVVDRTLTIPDNYRDLLESGCSMVAVYGSENLDRAEKILIANDGEIQKNFAQPAAGIDRSTDVDRTEGRTIQLLSETLRVNKQKISAGEVRVRKEVRTEQQTVQVPVSREELVIERVPVEGESVRGAIGSDSEIRVPLSEERVEVEKRPVVREAVKVGKRSVEETRNVSDQVRHEELKVDKTGNVNKIDDVDDLDRKRTA